MLVKDLTLVNSPWAVNLKYILSFVTLQIEDIRGLEL